MKRRVLKISLALLVAAVLTGSAVAAVRSIRAMNRVHVTAYFDNTNGLFAGDEVRILGVPVGAIEAIEPQPDRVKVSIWYDGRYQVPADAKAAVLSPTLITSRAIQLTPAYTTGATMREGSVIPLERTAVPIEFDDLRSQLAKLTDALQPTEPGGVSTLGTFVNTAADNLRGQGAQIRRSIITMSQAFSALGDRSDDLFGTLQNLSILVSALQDSKIVLKDLNQNLAGVTALLANDPNEIGNAIRDLNAAVTDVKGFLAENKEPLGTATDKLASISQAITDNMDQVKQALHVLPNAFQNFANIYQPAQSALTGALAVNNFANPIDFLCGAIQAASRLGAEQSAKLCVQYLAPIVKNRQYNFLPVGLNPFVGASARPNEVTYSEDWMRPDYVPPTAPPNPAAAPAPSPGPASLAAEAAPADTSPTGTGVASSDPSTGLAGMMVPQQGGA